MEKKTLPARSEVPVEETWNLENIFPDVASWEQAKEDVLSNIPALAEYKGKLSEGTETLVWKDGEKYKQEYKKGIPQYPVKKIGDSKETGTQHTFQPDDEIFEETD